MATARTVAAATTILRIITKILNAATGLEYTRTLVCTDFMEQQK